VKVFFYGNVLDYTNNDKTYEAGNCSNVKELAGELENHYGTLFRDFLSGDENCFFLVNGKGLMMTGGMNTKLQPDDKIELLPFTEAG
jgi:molybdopterin converting factor small subunit